MRVLYLTPDLFGAHGGIARHSRIAIKALSQSVERLDVLAMMDPPRTRPDARYFGGRSYESCGGDRRRFVVRVARAVARGRYDVVISGHVNLAPLMFMARRARRVTMMHGVDVWNRLSWPRRMALRRSNLLIAVSRFTADAARQANNLDPRRIAVVHNCLDPFLAADVGPPHAPADKSLLTVARMLRAESSKGHATVLHALPSVIRSIPDVRYDIVGDGDLRPDLQELAANLHLNGHVRFLGTLSDDALHRLYRECAAYVMPSKWEGFGLVFLEAMAHARPIIASTRDAAAEVLDDAAILVDPDNPAELADAIRTLLASPELQAKLGHAAHVRLREHFTFDRFKTHFIAQLEQACRI